MKTRCIFMLWILFIGSESRGACIPGSELLYQRNRFKPAFGKDQQTVYFNQPEEFPQNLTLKNRPDFKDSQIYIIAFHSQYPLGQAALIESDWCYNEDNNAIHFLKTPPNLRSWGEDIGPALSGSEFWIAYFSSKEIDPECPLGQALMGLPGDQNDDLIGQDYFEWQNRLSFNLSLIPQQNHGMVLRTTFNGSAVDIFPDDWCFHQKSNSLKFLRIPPRKVSLGGIPGSDIHDYDGIWAAYVP